MSSKKERTFQIADEAIKGIRENAEAATPVSFEIWYTHLMGNNPHLSVELKRALEEQRPLNEIRAKALHKQFFANDNIADEVLSFSDGISEAVTKILQKISEGGSDYQQYSAALKDARDGLGSIKDSKGLSDLVAVLADATQKMSSKSAALELQLAAASTELIGLREDLSRAREEAYTDGLTGIANRKKFDMTMADIIAELPETGEEACLVLGDVDHFKKFNDTWGHQVGDQVLKLVASGLKANTKGRDLVARYGGEEFAVILPNTSLRDARALADRLRTEISARRLIRRTTNEVIGHVTISFGIVQIAASNEANAIVERADLCLYEAKHRGRNCVVAEDELPAKS